MTAAGSIRRPRRSNLHRVGLAGITPANLTIDPYFGGSVMAVPPAFQLAPHVPFEMAGSAGHDVARGEGH
jgi:hypothetical protein